jgi:hypothetical protein
MRIKTCGAGPSFEECFATGFAAAFTAGLAADFAAACRAEVRDEVRDRVLERVRDKVRADDFVALRLTALRAARRVDRLLDLLAVI